jgi:hypothetical protein
MSDPKPKWGGYAELKRIERERMASGRNQPPPNPADGSAPVGEAIADSAIENSATMEKDGDPLWQVAIVANPATVANSTIVKPISGYTRVPNTILDSVLAVIAPTEQSVYLRLFRLSHGYGKPTCMVGYDALAKACHVSTRTVQTAIARLEQRGLIAREAAGKTVASATVYRVLIPGTTIAESAIVKSAIAKSAIAKSAHNKEDLKENYKRARSVDVSTPLSVYDVRRIAARFREVERDNPQYGNDELRADVRRALIGGGMEADDKLLDEAIGS